MIFPNMAVIHFSKAQRSISGRTAISAVAAISTSGEDARRYCFLVNGRGNKLESRHTALGTSRILIVARDARLIVHESNPRDGAPMMNVSTLRSRALPDFDWTSNGEYPQRPRISQGAGRQKSIFPSEIASVAPRGLSFLLIAASTSANHYFGRCQLLTTNRPNLLLSLSLSPSFLLLFLNHSRFQELATGVDRSSHSSILSDLLSSSTITSHVGEH